MPLVHLPVVFDVAGIIPVSGPNGSFGGTVNAPTSLLPIVGQVLLNGYVVVVGESQVAKSN